MTARSTAFTRAHLEELLDLVRARAAARLPRVARHRRLAYFEPAGFNAPARALYSACGFELVSRALTFVKTVPEA